MSSPTRDIPTRAESHPLANRRLDFSTTLEQPRQSIERSPLKSASKIPQPLFRKSGKLLSVAGNGKKKAFNLTMDSDEEDSTNLAHDNDPSTFVTEEAEPTAEEKQLSNGEDFLPPLGDESLQLEEDDNKEEQEETVEEEAIENSVVEPTKKRGRPKKDLSNHSSVRASPMAGKPVIKSKLSRKRAISETLSEEPQINGVTTLDSEPPTKKAGRPKKKEKVHQSEPEDEPEATPETAPTKGRRRGPKPPPSERNPNARITSAKKAVVVAATPTPPPSPIPKKRAPAIDRKPPKTSMPPPATAPLSSRSLQMIRSGTPAEESGARLLRSGRVSYQPLAFWRGERAVMTTPRKDGPNLLLPSVREVVRVDEVPDNTRKRAGSRRPNPSKSKKRKLADLEDESEEEELEEGEELEPWEINPGILHAEVVRWDPEWKRGDPEDYESTGTIKPLPSPFLELFILYPFLTELTNVPAQISHSPLLPSNPPPAKSEALHSSTPKPSPSPSSAQAWSISPPEAKNAPRNVVVCKWSSSFIEAESKLMLAMCRLVWAGAGCGRFREVSRNRRERVWPLEESPPKENADGTLTVLAGNTYGITNTSSTITARIFFAQGCEVPEFENPEGQAEGQEGPGTQGAYAEGGDGSG